MKRLIVIFIVLYFSGCKEPPTPQRTVVVEGYLFAGQPIGNISISLVDPITNPSLHEPVTNAQVFIDLNNASIELLQTEQAGVYSSINDSIKVKSGTTYHLSVEYKDVSINATTTIPTPPTSLSISNDTLHLNTIDDAIKAQWQMEKNSWYLGVVEPIIPDSTAFPFNNFLSTPLQDNTLDIKAENIQFKGKNKFILYSITKEFADIYRISSSSIGSSNAGNIENGFGIFSGFASDTVQFYVK